MTNEYKQNVLHYLTGDLPNQSGVNEPQIVSQTISNNLYTNLLTYFNGIYRYTAYVGSKDNSQNSLNYSILCVYGEIKETSADGTGIVILDEDNNIVQVITTWSDGTAIGDICCMRVDNSGNYYAVERNNNNYKIVQLNNIVLKLASQNHYQATKINSYNIPNTTYTWNWVNAVFKKEDNSKYFIIAERDGNEYITGAEYDISNNTWTYYTSSQTWSAGFGLFPSINEAFNVYWDSDNNIQFQIGTYTNDTLHYLTKGSGTTMVNTSIFHQLTNAVNESANFIFYSNEIGYLALTGEDENNNTCVFDLIKVNVNTSERTLIFSSSSPYSHYNKMYLFKSNGIIYYCKLIEIGENIDSDLDQSKEMQVSFGLIDNISASEETLGSFIAQDFRYVMCYPNVINQFNKNKVYLQGQEKLFIASFNWNSNEYNGEEYISSGSLVPEKAGITDDNEVELFNRDLYNLTTYLNTYTATMQIPNQFLNNNDLDSTKLYSKNNNIMVNKQLNLTKNKYEELNINFINKFTITDDETGNENLYGASDLIYNTINRVVGGELTKIRINYKDNTSTIFPISLNSSSTDNATYSFIIFIDKLINNIEMISNDEYTTYQTIDGSNLEVNKYYKINQRVRVE